MKRLIIILLATISISTQAQTDSLFVQANEAYAAGNYRDAIEQYTQTAQSGEAAELYYNLGNAYYKTGEIGLAILNYERALRIKPFYSDAKYNLKIARNRIIDKEDETQVFFISKWISSLMNLLPSPIWTWISIGLFLAFLVLMFVFAFGKSIGWRKFGFQTAIVFLFLSIVGFTFAGITHNKQIQRRDAIVMTEIVTVKSSPDKSGTDLFVLHEGIKVTIQETLGEWCEIKFGNGNVGWIRLSTLERI